MEGNEVGILSKAPDWQPLFLLKIKIETQAAQARNIMQSSSTFIRTSGSILKVKKSPLINDYENIIAYSEESEQSEV